MVPPSKSFGSSGAPEDPEVPMIRSSKVDFVVLLRMHSSKETRISSVSGHSYAKGSEPEVCFAVMIIQGLSD